MKKNIWIFLLFAGVLTAPILLRPSNKNSRSETPLLRNVPERAEPTLVIITPHNEATRSEFEQAFRDDYFKKTGRWVQFDWRTPGGTSEIARYLASEYLSSFKNDWVNKLHQHWDASVESTFDDPKSQSPARNAFLESNAGCGIDLFFGGGAYDLSQQAEAGRLVDCGVINTHPELFNDHNIPQKLGGETYWDSKGRWIGTCLSAYGICYNPDSLARLGIKTPPSQWSDLADPRYFGQVALADPTQSGSVAKAFEMMIQQQMAAHPDSLNEGWLNAWRLIQKIAANARYFTDAAPKIPYDVAAGDAAVGMCIDFYGRFQSESVRKEDGSSRLQYVSPAGGSSVGADPIGMLRGAPHQEVARKFIEFVLSMEGQKLWNWKVGTPGGPVRYALRRLPIRRELYQPEFKAFRSDPSVDPYIQASTFIYHEKWTGPLFRSIGWMVRVMGIDPHAELKKTWQELILTGFPPKAMAVFSELSAINYETASGTIKETLRSGKKIDQVKLAKKMSDSFREQYQRAFEKANEHGNP